MRKYVPTPHTPSGVPRLIVISFRLANFIGLLVFAAACGSATAASAAACDLVAAPSGSDGAAGTYQAPLRSPQRLVDRLRPGQTGCLRGGTYRPQGRDGYVVRFGHGGRRGAPLVLRGYPGEQATLAGVVYVTRQAPNVTVSDLRIDDRTPYGRSGQLTVQINARRTTLRRVHVTNGNRKTCVILGAAGAGTARRTTIADSVLERCGDPRNGDFDHAIYSAQARNLRVTGTLITQAAAYAVHLYPNTQGAIVRGNLLIDNGGGVIVAGEGDSASSGSRILRNVIVGNGRLGDIATYWGGRVGRRNVARGNCTSGGDVDGGRGLRVADNIVGDLPQVVRSQDAVARISASRCRDLLSPALAAAVRLAR